MCGITGFYQRAPDARDPLTALARSMATRLLHRGPDDSGEFVDEQAGLGLGFRRLAIIDLTEAGHQPMHSPSGRYVLVFNGEMYNFATVREELERGGHAPAWRGHSDTEVLLAAVEAWGVPEAVSRFVGMFAFALWDRKERALHLVRDRIGVKPLYYSIVGETVIFGSELKALAAHPKFDRTIDRDALALYARYGYVPAPYTIHRGTRKLEPGSILTIPATGAPARHSYWSVEDAVTRSIATPFRGSDAEALEQLDVLTRDAVRLRMISDVPLGVFLSGGIDSSTVAALMQAQNSNRVKTFSIGFTAEGYDEAQSAAAVARHLGTEHTELYVTPEDALAVIPLLPKMYDEPFADASQIPTYLVSQLARRSVTVALSGDGGDELFAGYNRHFLGRSLWHRTRSIPAPLRRAAGAMLRAVPMSTWNRALAPRNRFLPRALRRERAGERIHKLGDAMAVDSSDVFYGGVVSRWTDVVLGASEPKVAITDSARWPHLDDFTDRAMYFDQVSFLPDDILVKVDRASMAVSLEAREPLLDHRLIEFAWTLPVGMKVRGGKGKWLLRQLLNRYVPEQLTERPKQGFGLPINEWLRGPLRGWAESLLDETRLRQDGFFDPRKIRARWDEHLRGTGEWEHYLWTILMFQAWLREGVTA
jgi:asparagine synthase (glutamine-hydrolysing)